MVAAATAAAFAAAAADAAAAARRVVPPPAPIGAPLQPLGVLEQHAKWSALPPPKPPPRRAPPQKQAPAQPAPRRAPPQPAPPPQPSDSAAAGRCQVDPSPHWVRSSASAGSSRHQGQTAQVAGPKSQVEGVLAYLIVNARRAIVQRSSHSRCSIVAESEQSFRRKRVIIELANCLKWLQAAPEQLRSSLK